MSPDTVLVGGVFRWEAVGLDGLVRARGWMPNGITTAALNDLLEVYFRSGSQKASWYAGLISSTSYSALAAADTMSSHSGWTEATAYTPSTRPQWSPGAASSGVVLNSAAFTYTFTAEATVKGFFVASDSTKSGTTGTLLATGLFSSDQTFQTGEVLRGFYQLTAAAGSGS